MNFEDLNCNYQRLDDKEFRIKFKTGDDIYNVTGISVAGEIFITTGDYGGLYFATQTNDENNNYIYKAADIPTGNKLT